VPYQSVFNRQSTFRPDGCARLEEDCGECLLGLVISSSINFFIEF